MKILYIITKSELGGAQTHVADLCKHFSNSENKIAVLTDQNGWLTEEVGKFGVKVYLNEFFGNSFNPIRVFQALLRTKKIMSDFSPDLVHCHSSAAGFFGRLVVRGRVRTLYTAHGWGFNVGVSFIQKWIAIVVERWMAHYTEKIICVADFVRDLGLRCGISRAEKMIVIRNGVRVLVGFQKKTNSRVEIVFVGRLAPPKRPHDLLLATKELSNIASQDFFIKIIGAGLQFGYLKKYIVQNGLKNVELMGSMLPNVVMQNLLDSDIFVLPTDWEGLPYTILEAMACGLPVVASNVGGVSEAVTPECGLLVSPKSISELVSALKDLIMDGGRRRTLGANGRERVLNDFSHEIMFDKISNLYDNKAIVQ